MMPDPPSTALNDAAFEPAREWEWRRARNVGVSVSFWPIEWHIGWRVESDEYCWVGTFDVGPFVVTINVNDGSGLKWFSH